MDEAQLSVDDIAPILGNQQLTIITQQKQLERLRARIAELEGQLERVNGKKKEAIPQ